MAVVVYLLCAVTSVCCAGLLVREYLTRRVRLLLWSSLCFVFLALNNLLLLADFVVFPESELGFFRTASALIGVTLLLYGLLAEAV